MELQTSTCLNPWSAMPNPTPTSSPLLMENVPAPPAPLRLHVTSDAANLAGVRRAVEAYALAAGFDDAASNDIGLVLNEAMANVIRHAYRGQSGRPIDVEAVPAPFAERAASGNDGPAAGDDAVALRIRLRDWGNGVDPRKAPKRGYTPGVPGGLGLVCLGQLVDHCEYAPQPGGGMLLTLGKKRRGEAR